MFGLSTVAVKAIGIGLAILALIAGFALFTAHEQELGAEKARADVANASMKLAQDNATKSEQLAAKQGVIANDAELQAVASASAASAAASERDAARVQLASFLRRRATAATSAASGSGAAADDGLLAQLLDASWSRNLSLAAEADARGTAGLACERSYDGARTALNGGK